MIIVTPTRRDAPNFIIIRERHCFTVSEPDLLLDTPTFLAARVHLMVMVFMYAIEEIPIRDFVIVNIHLCIYSKCAIQE